MSIYVELHEFAYGLAEEVSHWRRVLTKASAMIKAGATSRWSAAAEVSAKKNTVDAVEAFIRTSISQKYPDHRFIGEESYEAGDRAPLTDEWTWIVDPIDGTMNFVHSFPAVACSIGVCYLGEPVIGVIAQPFLGRICLIATEWGSDRSHATFAPKVASFAKLAGDPEKGVVGGIMSHGLRTSGSSACNIASIIAGELDIYWDAGQYIWDVAAGAAILAECGGFYAGGKFDFERGASFKDFATSNRWVCVRACGSTEAESPQEIQRRLIGELYSVVEEWTTDNMQSI